MSEERKTALYAMNISEDNIAFCEKQRFSRITPDYILTLTEEKPPMGAVEIGKDEMHRLTGGDERWLIDCGALMLADEIKGKETDILDDLRDKVDRLEAALKEAAEGGGAN